MNPNLTDLTIIMDRSGSMQDCRQEAENGINRLIEEQKQEKGDCNFTLVQFDDLYNVLYDGVPIADVDKVQLEPRGMTALLDAVGKTLNTVGSRLASLDEDNRPGLVMVVIVTDGQENASREFRLEQIREMITHQQEKYNWQFTFLGANQNAFAAGHQLGISATQSASYTPCKYASAMGVVSNKMSSLRAATANSQDCSFAYSDDDREEME